MAPAAALPYNNLPMVIDIASPEELFEHEGPLLAEDTDWYWFAKDDVQAGGSGLQKHIDRVMEQIKVRKESEVRTRIDSAVRTAAQRTAPQWDAHVEGDQAEQGRLATEAPAQTEVAELMKATMESLEAARQRMELRARAAAALQAAASRASADQGSEESGATGSRSQREEPVAVNAQRNLQRQHAGDAGERTSQDRVVQATGTQWRTQRFPPPPPAHAAPGASKLHAEALAQHRLQDRINQIVAQAQNRNKGGVMDFSEAATTASNNSAFDSAESSSESGAEPLQRPWSANSMQKTWPVRTPPESSVEPAQRAWPADHMHSNWPGKSSSRHGVEPVNKLWYADRMNTFFPGFPDTPW